jgi:prevent-host-death family protein
LANVRFSEDVRPVSEFRANTAALIEQVQATGRPILLTQHGRGAAVLLNVNEYERLMEHSEALDDIRVGEAQLDRGEGVDHDSALKQVRARLKL